MTFERWRDDGGNYVYHYTGADLAREIAADEHFLVGDGAVFGPGLYATDLAPQHASPSTIRDVCFGGDAPEIAFDGVLVLLADDPLTPFKEVDERVFRLPAEEGVGELIPVHSILVAVGRRRIGGGWQIEAWP